MSPQEVVEAALQFSAAEERGPLIWACGKASPPREGSPPREMQVWSPLSLQTKPLSCSVSYQVLVIKVKSWDQYCLDSADHVGGTSVTSNLCDKALALPEPHLLHL